jgi:hypothetical protein
MSSEQGIRMTVDHAERRVTVNASGSITLDDILKHIEQERTANGLGYAELIDARGYVPAFSADQVRTVVEVLRDLAAQSPLGPTAIVVDSDVGFGMLRMLEIMMDDVCKIRPFRDMSEARRWLESATD